MLTKNGDQPAHLHPLLKNLVFNYKTYFNEDTHQ